MKKLTEARANELKEQGITHIASIMKSHYDTKYFNYDTTENIMANGGKMSPCGCSGRGYRIGVNGRYIDWKHCIRWSEI